MSDLTVIYSTFGSDENARTTATTLVEEQLLACANLIPGVISIYGWQGKTHADPEIILIGKTRADLAQRAMARLKELHAYEVPCITSWSIAACDLDYAAWVRSAGPAGGHSAS